MVCFFFCLVFFVQEHSRCFSDCFFSHTENNRTLTFDLSPMSDVASLTVGPSFTTKGTKYLRLFNVSLCGHEVTDRLSVGVTRDRRNHGN